MKILLIEPAKAPQSIGGEDVYIFEPLALEYVAAGVAQDHDVMLLDMRLDKNLQAVLDDFCPDVVGITAYTVHVNTVRNLFDNIKKWNPRVLTVVGGHHATVVPEDFQSESIDLVVIGEGVFTFKSIIERFEQGRGYDDIDGIAYQQNGKLVKTESTPLKDLDIFPLPKRDLSAKYRNQYYSEWMKPLASIRTSKGCPFRCNFCALWKLTNGRYLRREPEKIVEELTTIDEEFVFFADDESLVDAKRMKKLAGLLKACGLKKRYFLYGRSDTIAKNADLLELWRDVGLERIFVGLEFFRDEDLNYIRKNSTTGDNEKAIKILQDLGIDIYASFIIRPEFDHKDFTAFRQYCRALGLTYATFAVLTPLPGTDFYEEVKEKMITHNYDYFDFIHTLLPTTLPVKEFYEDYVALMSKARTFSDQIAFMKKYPVKEIPSLFKLHFKIMKQLKNIYKDYNN